MLGYTSYRDWSPAGATQQQLSVVTTVWGVTTSTQSGPHGNFATGNGPPPGANNGYGHQSLGKQTASSFPGAYRQSVPGVGGYGVAQTGAGMNGAPGGGTGVTDGTGGQQYHQGNALSTAAMVAAATATATATASVVALQENNQFNQMQGQQYGSGYGQQRGHGPMGMSGMGMNPMNSMANMGMNAAAMHNNMMGGMGPGTMNMNKMAMQGPGSQVYPRRLAPYPSPAMHMSQKRGQQGYPSTGPGPGPTMQPGYNPNTTQYPAAYANGRPGFQSQYPPQQALGPSGTFGPSEEQQTGTMSAKVLVCVAIVVLAVSTIVAGQKIVCNRPNEHYACGSACQVECKTFGETCPIVNIRCNDACYCDDGFARNAQGICIPVSECPPKTA
ncbi:uncharacterized protein CBL_04553 [Carabus blaptoides fortunei]